MKQGRKGRVGTHQRHLEWRRLKADIASRRIRKHESKVNVNEVSIAVDEDVSVMPVLDLEEVRHDRVTSEGFDKVALSAAEASRLGFAVCL